MFKSFEWSYHTDRHQYYNDFSTRNDLYAKNALPHYMPGFKVFDFALPAALQDKASVSIRLRCASLTGTDGKSSVVPNATNRLGHVSIKYNK